MMFHAKSMHPPGYIRFGHEPSRKLEMKRVTEMEGTRGNRYSIPYIQHPTKQPWNMSASMSSCDVVDAPKVG